MLTNEELVAEYAYLDDLDFWGEAWELLRRNDEYRADYDRLQGLERPSPFDSEHGVLAEKWHVRRLLNPNSHEVPEFFHDRWQNFPNVYGHPGEWEALWVEKKPPKFKLETFKRSIICKDLKNRGCSLNEIARRLYPGFKGKSHQTQHHPARHRVQGDLKRFNKLQAEYIKIAYSNI